MFRPCLFCSEKLPKDIKDRLICEFDIISLPPHPLLDLPVASHPDMLLFKHGDSVVIHAPYLKENKALLEPHLSSLKVISTDENIGAKYPHDVLLNAFYMGDALFAKQDSISRFISERFVTKINLKQGYAACSVCKVDENSLITGDPDIAKNAKKLSLSVLLISAGHIRIKGYDCGFIGGASFVTKDAVNFFGDIKRHPDHEKIIGFINSKGKRAISLSSDVLTDYGGALVLS